MKTSIVLPDSLLAQIRAYEQRLKRMETLWAVAGGFAGLFITLLALMLLDRFVDTPKWGRAALLVSGVLAASWFFRKWSKNWLYQKRRPAELAKLVGKHFRSLGDRLQGVVELANAKDLPVNVSEALCLAAIRQVAEESKKHEFTEAVPTKPTRKWVMAGGVVAAFLAGGFALARRAATNAAERWAKPLADVERYTFAGLEQLPEQLVVPHGEPFQLAIALRKDTEWRPELAKASIERQDEVVQRIIEDKAVLEFPGQTREGQISLRVGDARKAVKVKPVYRPELKSLLAHVTLPAYLQHPDRHVKVSGAAEFLEGSWVEFQGEVGRPLNQASLLTPAASQGSNATKGVHLLETGFRTAPWLVDDLEGQIAFSWKDSHDIAPVRNFQSKLATVKDGEPKVELRNLDPELALLPEEILKLDLLASDDFGIRESWVSWTVFPSNGEKKALSTGELKRLPGSPDAKEASMQVDWSPVWHKIPEDTIVELSASTVDYFPERAPSSSWKHTILIMSPAKHAERIRDRMDSALKVLDDRIRDEETNVEETKELAENKEQLGTEKAAEKIQEAEAKEKENQNELGKTLEEMEDILNEAIRNKEVPEDTLAEWKKLTEKLQQKADPAMAKAQQAMQQAAQQAQPQEQEKQLAEAQEQQEQALEAMKEAAQEMDKVSENLFARNFYNRLKQASQQQNQVADGMKKLARETAGLLPEEIDAKSKDLFETSARKQDETVKGVEEIQKDMSVFVTRLPNEKYQKVLGEIESTKAIASLAELSGIVRANLGLKSVGMSRKWSKQLGDWAEMLRDESPPQEGEGEGQQEMPPEMMELLIALVRAAQQQDTIREQTLAIDKIRWENLDTLNDANRVADLQAQLADSMHQLKVKTPVQEAKPLLDQVGQLMSNVTGQLRATRTDAENTGLQSAIIELLVPPDQKSDPKDKKQKPKNSPMAKMQQQAREMMAKGQKPGRSTQKGGGDILVEGAQGVAIKDQQNMRTVEKGGGSASAGEWPEEFRDALQQYFNRIETEVR